MKLKKFEVGAGDWAWQQLYFYKKKSNSDKKVCPDSVNEKTEIHEI